MKDKVKNASLFYSVREGGAKQGARGKRTTEMTAQKIFDIMSSSSKEDWLNLEEHELFVYKDDVHLRIQKRHVDYSEKFEGEEWAINHP